MKHKHCKKKPVEKNICEVCNKPIREPREEDIKEAIRMFNKHPFLHHRATYEDGTTAMNFTAVNPNLAEIAIMGRDLLQEMGVWEDFLMGKFKHLEE